MIEQTGIHPHLGKVTGWVATNLLVVFFIGIVIAFTWLPFFLHSTSILPPAGIVFLVILFGGGILIAVCQALFLRLSHIDTPGSAWRWIGSGIISSVVSFLAMGVVLLIFSYSAGETPQPEYQLIFDLTLMVWTIGAQKSFLAIVQGVQLKRNKYRKVLQWLVINVLGYGFGQLISATYWDNLYKTGNADNGGQIVFSILLVSLVILVEIASGRRFIQVLDTGEAWAVDPAFQKAIRSARSIQADSEEKI